MSSKKRKCYICQADLTSKQYSRTMYKGEVRITCEGKCKETILMLVRKEGKGK